MTAIDPTTGPDSPAAPSMSVDVHHVDAAGGVIVTVAEIIRGPQPDHRLRASMRDRIAS